ncbi:hypothetical protein M885DRAFT_111540 [Pelagophyceae sp. CCMP2097]|nr:hypothetical protein M885DRAFT_111540 [Pelagophyceae sp. CCMP2097]
MHPVYAFVFLAGRTVAFTALRTRLGGGRAGACTSRPGRGAVGCASSKAAVEESRFPHPLTRSALGVLRLDYDYPPAPGDVDSPLSWDYRVYYRCVPGYTFDMCKSNKLSQDVKVELEAATKWLEAQGCSGITGDCGFMMQIQPLIRNFTKLPVFMSSLVQLPTVRAGFSNRERIAIFSANGGDLHHMFETFRSECNLDSKDEAFVIVGCEKVDGFDAVELGGKVNVTKVQPGIVAKAVEIVKAHPDLRAILMECTELPAYSDAVRNATGLPVYDAITCCNMQSPRRPAPQRGRGAEGTPKGEKPHCSRFMAGVQNNPRFGLEEWQRKFDGEQEAYVFGQHLTPAQRANLVNKPALVIEPASDALVIDVNKPASDALFDKPAKVTAAAA